MRFSTKRGLSEVELGLKCGNAPEIYRAEPGRRRECLYYLALGYYKMGNYEDAQRFNGA